MEILVQPLALLFDLLISIGNMLANIPGAADNGIEPVKATHSDSVYVAIFIVQHWQIPAVVICFGMYSYIKGKPAKARVRR